MKRVNQYWHIMKVIMACILLFLFLNTYVFTGFLVDGRSMEPTLADGHMVMVNEMIYTYQPIDHFDVIVFQHQDGGYFVKRVIGLPDDQIEMKDGSLYLDGEKVDEPYTDDVTEQMLIDDFTLVDLTGESEVPEGQLFVLGDNRMKSLDSRSFGFINEFDVLGKVDIRYWPMSQIATLFNH
ncbi:signal peptidase I [Amphibacillus jilinensis]|uniref:signal peptidase I n=1 Tax=Amphibacillus jilinensis TaxID=1216008 RepID=UPI000310F2C6|nr:signal peptidase I [Amphibacillus jilinensis]